MTAKFKPLLAAAIEDTSTLRLPMLASPKLDGIRCIVMDGVGYSRSLKPIPNAYVQSFFASGDYDGLDGELIVGEPTSPSCYRDTNSGVLSRDGEPDFRFYVFDRIDMPDCGFEDRFEQGLGELFPMRRLVVVPHAKVHDENDLLAFETEWLEAGYEGVMLRSLNGPYKNGRSTLKEGTLLKLKRFADAEFEVVGFEELLHNENEATTDELGYTKRSSHAENKIGGNVLGALVLRHPEAGEFRCGTGFTAEMRAEIWTNRDAHLGRLAKIKHFEIGVKTLPRFPVFLGWREEIDL